MATHKTFEDVFKEFEDPPCHRGETGESSMSVMFQSTGPRRGGGEERELADFCGMLGNDGDEEAQTQSKRHGAASADFDLTLCSPQLRKLIEDQSFFEPKPDTQMWTSRISYLFAAVGSAVGVGNIWRFPFLCYRNGGATFLIPYLISLFGLAIPLFAL